MSKRERRELDALAATERAAFDAGCDYLVANPDVIILEAYREAARRYENKHEIMAFAQGFATARRKRNEYLSEKETE
ncbi:MAG TPA: hypothetical protein VKE42_08245 [Candidatus Cybelea sp.]|nr:hypothetical protein [Candidatus Cybelea sp.]